MSFKTTEINSFRESVFIEAFKILLPEVKSKKNNDKEISYDSVVRDSLYIADVAVKEYKKD
jgi:hypothetical protein